MEHVVRCYCINDNDEILLAKASSDQLWTLPWGHIDEWESMHQALERELQEEFALDITIVWSESLIASHSVSSMPLPIAVYTVQYEHRSRGNVKRMEYVFFARCDTSEVDVQEDEIYDYQWTPIDDVVSMKADDEIYSQYIDILDQNVDLLELL